MADFILSAFADEIDMDLKIQMEVLNQHNINYIEMRGVNGKGVVEYSLKEVEDIKKELDKNGFKISAIGSPLGKIEITDDFEPHLELFKHTLKIAEILETDYIRMFSFFIPEGDKPEEYRKEVMNRWNQFIEEAEGSGITLLHENEKEIYGDTPERCLDLLETMDCKYFKAIFDPANFIQCDVITYPNAYKILEEHIEYLHIKDAIYSDHSVVPSGQGDGKIKEILTDLYNKDFEGFLSLEPHLGSFEGLGNLERNSDFADLPDGGPRKFAIAAEALKDILNNIVN
ncbi:MAG: sugar phosphate isomerase/epimerase family protein [Halanaerobiales bacterium]